MTKQSVFCSELWYADCSFEFLQWCHFLTRFTISLLSPPLSWCTALPGEAGEGDGSEGGADSETGQAPRPLKTPHQFPRVPCPPALRGGPLQLTYTHSFSTGHTPSTTPTFSTDHTPLKRSIKILDHTHLSSFCSTTPSEIFFTTSLLYQSHVYIIIL